MSWTFTTSAKSIKKAGEHADSTITADTTTLGNWSDMAEGYICSMAETDFLTNYSSLDTLTKYMLDQITSSLIALQIITWNTTGYLTNEADFLMNLNDGIVEKGINKLKDTKGVGLKSPV